MKLSVIIPAYNRADLIEATIESILDAGLEDFEIVVVDDGSTDRTPEVVGAMGPPVFYLRKENGGLASARNAGFAASHGRYVAFLDSDDLWLPGAVGALIEHLDEREEIPFLFGDAQMGSPEDGFRSFVGTFAGEALQELPSREVRPGVRRFDRRPFFRLLVRRNLMFLGSMVSRREVLEQIGPFDSVPYGAEDWHYFLRLGLQYDYHYCEDLPVATYVQHSSNMTKDQDRMNYGFSKALERLLEEPGLEAEEREYVLHHLRRSKFCYAYPAYDRGDLLAARERFVDCLRCGFAWKPFAYWIACQFPPPILRSVRFLKQRWS